MTGWLRALFQKPPVSLSERFSPPATVKAMCDNCFAVIMVPEGEWWCSDCEGKFHALKSRVTKP